MNSGVRDGYRYFFVLCGGCAPVTPPRLREDEKVLAETAEIAEENNKSD